MDILLDTHTFLWLDSRLELLSENAVKALTDADNILYLSSISDWEIAQKFVLGKLPLPLCPSQYLTTRKSMYGIETLTFDNKAAFELEKLPLLHKDPLDRMLICQAIEHGLTIVTNDRYIEQYPIKTLW